MSRERPSRHGLIVGEALTRLATHASGELPVGCCATCAFRPGCMTNQMASTVLVAFKCAVGADQSPFGCHHGLSDGEPTRACAGWVAAQLVDFADVKAISADMTARLSALDQSAPDPIREAFDAWLATADPDNRLNDYERGRLYLRATTPNPKA